MSVRLTLKNANVFLNCRFFDDTAKHVLWEITKHGANTCSIADTYSKAYAGEYYYSEGKTIELFPMYIDPTSPESVIEASKILSKTRSINVLINIIEFDFDLSTKHLISPEFKHLKLRMEKEYFGSLNLMAGFHNMLRDNHRYKNKVHTAAVINIKYATSTCKIVGVKFDHRNIPHITMSLPQLDRPHICKAFDSVAASKM